MSSIIPTHEHYVHTDPENNYETVDTRWVERFLQADTFFTSLGGTEKHTEDSNGVITVEQVTPWGDKRKHTFTPA